jgi:hypothetical protein
VTITLTSPFLSLSLSLSALQALPLLHFAGFASPRGKILMGHSPVALPVLLSEVRARVGVRVRVRVSVRGKILMGHSPVALPVLLSEVFAIAIALSLPL